MKIMKKLFITKAIINVFLIVALLFFFVSCEKDDTSPTQESLKSGLWTGTYNNGLEISIILDANMLVRADLVYNESDSDYNRANLKNVKFGPFTSGSISSFEIEETIKVDGKDVDVKISVNLNFATSAKATGQITTTEDNVIINTSDITLDWTSEIPTTGNIRDGSWSGGISSPVIVSFSFSTLKGVVDGIGYFAMDSKTMSIGSIGKGGTISIGDDFNFSINKSIDVELHFTGFMEGSGDVILDLVSGDTSVPVEVNWYPELP